MGHKFDCLSGGNKFKTRGNNRKLPSLMEMERSEKMAEEWKSSHSLLRIPQQHASNKSHKLPKLPGDSYSSPAINDVPFDGSEVYLIQNLGKSSEEMKELRAYYQVVDLYGEIEIIKKKDKDDEHGDAVDINHMQLINSSQRNNPIHSNSVFGNPIHNNSVYNNNGFSFGSFGSPGSSNFGSTLDWSRSYLNVNDFLNEYPEMRSVLL